MVEDVSMTEAGGDPTTRYESRDTLELVELMSGADATVPEAVAAATASGTVASAAPSIAALIDAIAERMRGGGRLVYVGAGSSGLIAALDATECEATFATAPGLVCALVAGGENASSLALAAAEDDRGAGAADVDALGVVAGDCVIGISASGRTPYVLGALEAAAAREALTACIVSAPGSPLAEIVEHELAVLVGPEFIAGSTRLKAGTAQKLVLNAISTITMIRLGKTYGNLMVDVVAANEKLRERVRRIVRAATGASPDEVDEAVDAADGDARVAIVALLADVDAATARARLEESSRDIQDAVERSR